MSIDGIIFDCDGVLFESRKANLAYYNTVLAHFGEPPVEARDRQKAHLCHTAASPKVFEVLLGRHRLEQAVEFAATVDYRRFIPFMKPEPELVETLCHLSARLPLAVATNRGTSMSEILRHFGLGGYFRAVLTSRDVLRPKPHPDMLLAAADRIGLPAARVLFVGDSELDRDAAAGAGMRFAAYGGLVKGDVAISGHRELVALVESFSGGSWSSPAHGRS